MHTYQYIFSMVYRAEQKVTQAKISVKFHFRFCCHIGIVQNTTVSLALVREAAKKVIFLMAEWGVG